MEENVVESELLRRLSQAKTLVAISSLYVHYKQKRYRVLDIALNEDTNEPCVVYQAEYGERLTFVRPVSVWLEEVSYNGKTVPRFAKV